MHFLVELNTSKTLFSIYLINKWNKVDPNNCTCSSHNISHNALLKLIGIIKRKKLDVNDTYGIKMLIRF